jgi:uncharacterized membrane protein
MTLVSCIAGPTELVFEEKMIDGDQKSNSASLRITESYPKDLTVNSITPIILKLATNQNANCRYSEIPTAFNLMTSFTITGQAHHETAVILKENKKFFFYVQCKNTAKSLFSGISVLSVTLQSEDINSPQETTIFTKAKKIINERCVNCHNAIYPENSPSRLQMVTENQWLNSGYVVASRPESSKLYYRIKNSKGSSGPKNMPLTGATLTDPELKILEDWIMSLNSDHNITELTLSDLSPLNLNLKEIIPLQLKVSSNNNAFCRYSNKSDALYRDMHLFTTTGEKKHVTTVTPQENKKHIYYIKCKTSELDIYSSVAQLSVTLDAPVTPATKVLAAMNIGGPALVVGDTIFQKDPTYPSGCWFGPGSIQWGSLSDRKVTGGGNLTKVFQHHGCNTNYKYDYVVPNGQVKVRLLYAETREDSINTPGRICTKVNGQTVVPSQVLGGNYGLFTAVEKILDLNITSGKVTIEGCGGIISGVIIERNTDILEDKIVDEFPLKPIHAINVGGKSYTAADGTIYKQDPNLFIAGSCNFHPDSFLFTSNNLGDREIKNSGNLKYVYQSHACDNISYDLNVPNGIYTVKLMFAETWEDAKDSRTISFKVNEIAAVQNFMIGKEIGVFHAVEKVVTVSVTDGKIRIAGNPLLSGIAVYPDTTSQAKISFAQNRSIINGNGDSFYTSVDITIDKASKFNVFTKVSTLGSTLQLEKDFELVNDFVYFQPGTSTAKIIILIKNKFESTGDDKNIILSFLSNSSRFGTPSGITKHVLTVRNTPFETTKTYDPALAPERFTKFQKVMETRCFACHRGGGISKMDDLLTEKQWRDSAYIEPGHLDSLLWQRMDKENGAHGAMPPQRPANTTWESEKQIVKDFILGLNYTIADCNQEEVRPITMRRLTSLELKNSISFLLNDDSIKLENLSDVPSNEDGFNKVPGSYGNLNSFYSEYYEAIGKAVNLSVTSGKIKWLKNCDLSIQTCRKDILTKFQWLALKGATDILLTDKIHFMAENLGSTSHEKMSAALETILLHPKFTNLIESENETEGAGLRSLQGREIAIRLSFFLWQSIPDEELLNKAPLLINNIELNKEIDRMIAHPRFDQFARFFVSNWLSFSKLSNKMQGEPFSKITSYKEETILFVKYIFQNNLPMGNILDGKFTFLNETMAKVYGLSGISGTSFNKVDLPENLSRGGILSHPAFLAMTGDSKQQLQAYIRGSWGNRVLLCRKLSAADLSGSKTDLFLPFDAPLEEQAAVHRSQKECFSCHKFLDPFGLALHQYDYRGKIRENDQFGNPIHSSGVLYTKQFNSYQQFTSILKEEKDFGNCFTRKVFSSALDFSESNVADQCATQKLAKSISINTGLKDFIKILVKSQSFKTKIQ